MLSHYVKESLGNVSNGRMNGVTGATPIVFMEHLPTQDGVYSHDHI